MKLGHIIEKCLPYVNLSAEDVKINNTIKGTEICKKFEECANTVYNYLYANYSKITKIEKLCPINKLIEYKNLSYKINNIIKITENGIKQSYKLSDEGIILENTGDVEIEYTFYPNEINYDSDLVLFDKVNEYGFMYLLCSEYCLAIGDYERSAQYYDKFIVTRNGATKKGSKMLKVSKWL